MFWKNCQINTFSLITACLFMWDILMSEIIVCKHSYYYDVAHSQVIKLRPLIYTLMRWDDFTLSRDTVTHRGDMWLMEENGSEKEVFSFFSTDRRTVEWARRASRVYLCVSHWPVSAGSTDWVPSLEFAQCKHWDHSFITIIFLS